MIDHNKKNVSPNTIFSKLREVAQPRRTQYIGYRPIRTFADIPILFIGIGDIN